MRYGSVCSGIEAASQAWEPLGWEPAWFAEIEKFPSQVLAHHWPQVANLGDMTLLPERIRSGEIEAPDILVGGTPCQAFSVAGLRNGLIDPRGALTIKYVEVADAIDEQRNEPCVVVWENVPGVLSSKDNAFGCFLAALVGEDDALLPARRKWTNAGVVSGPKRTAAWRVLDAQYFGVAQRRRRVFVVASARQGFHPAAILFESEGVRRDSAPSREKGEEVAGTLASRFTGGGYPGLDEAASTRLQPTGYVNGGYFGSMVEAAVGDPLRAKGGDTGNGGETLVCFGGNNTSGRIDFETETFVCATLDASFGRLQGCSGQENHGFSHLVPQVAIGFLGDETPKIGVDIMPTLRAEQGGEGRCVATALRVRRLMPHECEVLQGMAPGFTAIPKAADSPRYKAIGNSKAVPVVRWLGRRIDAKLKDLKEGLL